MVTMKDVAREAGVSKATVSYVLSGSRSISFETRDRVQAAVKKLNYTVNHAARTLSTRLTHTIGVSVRSNQGIFFPLAVGAYVYSLAAALNEHGYATMLMVGNHNPDELESVIQARRVDGVILLDVVEKDSRISVVQKFRVPTVLLGKPSDPRGLDVVDTDFEEAARSVVRVLHEAHHTNALFLGLPRSIYSQKMNYALRFRQALHEEATRLNMRVTPVYPDDHMQALSDGISEALKCNPHATAVIIHNDAVVASAQEAFAALGLRVPEDLSVITVVPDQLYTGAALHFTAVDISLDAVSEQTVNTLVRRLSDPDLPAIQTLVNQPLVLRNSIATLN